MRLPIALTLLMLASCAPPVAFTLSAGNTVELAVTDPGLFAAVDGLVVSLYANQGGQAPCSELVNLDVDDMVLRGPLSETGLAKSNADLGHIFGAIRAGGPHSVLILGTDGISDAQTLAAASGNVIAIGCEEVSVVQDQRSNISLTLFPAGRR